MGTKIAIFLQFWTIGLYFVQKGCCSWLNKITIFVQLLTIDPDIVQKGCHRKNKIVILLSFELPILLSWDRFTFPEPWQAPLLFTLFIHHRSENGPYVFVALTFLCHTVAFLHTLASLQFLRAEALNISECCRMLVLSTCEEWPSSVSGPISFGKFLVLAPGSKYDAKNAQRCAFRESFSHVEHDCTAKTSNVQQCGIMWHNVEMCFHLSIIAAL